MANPETTIKISKRELKWRTKFKELIKFRRYNPERWPQSQTDHLEKKLTTWCQTLRSHYRKGTLENNWMNKLSEIHFNFEGGTENKWKDLFEALKIYLQTHHELPHHSHKLYQWARAQLRSFNKLNREKQYLLNSIGFLRYCEATNWDKRYEEVKEFILFHKKMPAYSTNLRLYGWIIRQREKLRDECLSIDKIQKLKKLGIDLTRPVLRDITWNMKFEALVKFRQKNPERWPQSQTDHLEKKLTIWCQTLRSRYRKGTLETDWLNKLSEIHFNFKGTDDNWKKSFEAIKTYLQTYHNLPHHSHKLYHWAGLQYRSFTKLKREKQHLLNSIGFLKHCGIKSWDRRYKEVKEFIRFHKKVPTHSTNMILYGWIIWQREKFRNNRLSVDKIQKLKKLGIDLTKPDREAIWNMQFEALVKFRQKNPDRWPTVSHGENEKRLCIWCQAQRQIIAGTKINRKSLSKERIGKLKRIGFR